MQKYLFFTFVFTVLSFVALSQELNKSFVIDNAQTIHSNLNQYLYLLDNDEDDFEEILKLEDTFVPFQVLKDSLKKNHTYWGRITIHSPNSKKNWVLRLGIRNSQVTSFINDNHHWVEQKTGRRVPLYEKLIPEVKYDDLFINFINDSIHTIYFKVENIENREPNLNLQLIFVGRYYFVAKQKKLFQGIFLGVYFIMIFYNLLLFFSSKFRPFLYYSLYILGMAVYNLYFNGYLVQYLFFQNPEYEVYAWLFAVNWMIIFYYLFVMGYIESKHKYQFLHRVLSFVIIIRLLLLLILPIWWYFTLDFPTINNITIYSRFMEVLVIILIFINLLKDNNLVIRYFLAGTIFVNLFSLSSMLFYTVSLDLYILLAQFGVVGEILFLSLGLGRKMQENEKSMRLSQEKLIRQLQENKAYKEKVNQELEHKVLERTQNLNEAKEKIETQRDEILDSISYAQRIQNTILPQINEIQEYLPESFALFKPKDIVSGDFYWFATSEPKLLFENRVDVPLQQRVFSGFESEKIILATIDCTGHGVPGAFMSMIGDSLLRKIIHEKEVYQPAQILNEMDKGIVTYLEREVSDIKDGMDASIFTIDLERKLLTYAGARNPLVYVRNNRLYSIKGNNKSLGRGFAPIGFKGFTQTQISLENSNTMVYMFSDGFQDQFGGPKGKKIKRRPFYNLLLKIHQEPINKQKEILHQYLEDWMKESDQTQIDDIMVLGVRINL